MKTEVNPSQPKVQAEQKKSIMGSPSYRLLGVMEQVMKDLSNRNNSLMIGKIVSSFISMRLKQL